jgi:outer membrane protein
MTRNFPLIVAAPACSGPAAFGQPANTVHLTLAQAENLAIQHHPQLLAEQNLASAFGQQVVEAKAAYYPTLAGDATRSAGNQQARSGAGMLAMSRLFDRVGTGISVNQLVTDSGRTSNLVASARFRSDAAQKDYQATRYDILLRVNQAYYQVLRSQATIKVARQTVDARQLVLDQVTALANNKLRSQLDVTFADVSVSQAKLLLIEAQNQEQEAFAELTRAIGAETNAAYTLEEQPLPPSPPPDAEALIAQALNNRPEVASLRLERDAAYRFERAERDLKFPTVSLIAVGGYIPYVDQITLPRVIPGEYGGAAVNVHIPVFNGHLFSARREEAHFRAMEADQHVRDLEQAVARDVRSAWATATTAYQRLAVVEQLLRQATLSLDLAQGRYQLSLSSIVELTQAQLNVTQAEIESLSAKYNYQSQYAALQYALGTLR